MQQRNDLLIEQQVQQNMNINPTIASISIPDDKPLSPISVVKPQQNIHIYNKDYEGKILMLKRLTNYQEQDYPNGTFYGQMMNGKKHGQGLMLLQGRVCEGVWQNDRKHGHCKEIFDSGETFEGEYQNGKPQGKGVYIRNNESYDGQWVNGFKHGHGIWKMGNDYYEGEWKFGKIDGYGVYIQNNNKYTGSFRNNLKHGHGIENFANGDLYNGQFCNGKPEGQGTYIWNNGAEYRGMFKNGVRHGKGVWSKWDPLKEGHYRYEGMFENDKKHGQGVFTWPSGNYYVGAFVNDYRHGYGEMFWKDQYYKGYWERGMQHGDGELCKNGVIKKGRFENNVLTNHRSNSMWESGESNFKLANNLNQTFSHGISGLSQRSRYMPAIGRKPKLIMRKGDKTVILDNLIINDIPIENDPDFLTICPEPVQQKKFKPKMNCSQLLKQHFSTLRK
ncbi:unnamed protein product [Paramecium primaurelia]|uniref:MORN repeat protein n=1 Tax=Paramecium primaurelia TaxID=5886 RepID=A0A8S1PL17_PARPR|nr:unnamed protein product [Paramecium primaurelia]